MKNLNQWSKIERVAILAGVPNSTFRTWKSRGNIPYPKRDILTQTAEDNKIDLSEHNLRNPNSPDHIPTKAASGHPEQSPEFLHPQTQERIL